MQKVLPQVQPDLRILLIEITQRCNMACDHCGSRCDIDSPQVLTKDDIYRLLKDVKEHIGTSTMINISGGEPLIRSDIFEIGEMIHKMGFDWGMVTNGSLITDDKIRRMKESGMKTITISLDGLKETHESLRHLPGCFDRIIESLKKLKKADFLDTVQVTFTSNKRNIREFPKLYKLLDEIGIDSVRTSCIDPIGRAGEHRELLLDGDDFRRLFAFVNKVNRAKGHTPIIWGCPHFFDGCLDGRHFFCFTGIYAASVLYNGDIFVCPNVPRRPEFIQGNIRTDSFSKVWKEKLTWFRNRCLPEFCEGCKYASSCRGDSVHSYDFDNERPNFCYREMLELKEEDYFKLLRRRYKHFDVVSVEAAEPEKARNIYLDPDAYEDIRTYFHMGKDHPLSRFEQQVGLVGYKLGEDYVVKYVFPSVIHAFAADNAVFARDTVRHAVRQTKIIRINSRHLARKGEYLGCELKFLGFAHSHPIQEELQYSVGDEIIHKRMHVRFGDYIAILINPWKELMGAYYGKERIRQANLHIIEPADEK